jgi:Glycosyltransferase Family 4
VRRLRVLITNNGLVDRAGSELYVRDVALGLLEHGHHPIAYSTRLGPIADELRRATVPVIDDLDALGIAPDIIHGQHHLETMTAVLRFPEVPAVSFCHGWLPWEEMPAIFPSVQRYIAVDLTCRDRLLLEHGISIERIDVLYNFVDLDRFKLGPTLPDRPRRALVLSNAAYPDSHVVAVREACDRRGIHLDVVGHATQVVDRPEAILGDYDLVFAKARAAMEAMATGCAVILCDRVGAGPLVRRANFAALRELNFGIRALRDPITADHLGRQIDCYAPAEAAAVRDLLRSQASRTDALRMLLEIYDRAMIAPRETTSLAAATRAAARYLVRISPRVKGLEQADARLAVLQTAAQEHAATCAAMLAAAQEQAAADLAAAQVREATLATDLASSQARTVAREADLAAAQVREAALATDLTSSLARRAMLEAQALLVHHSPAMRLRRGVLALPLVGGLTRAVARVVLGTGRRCP